MTVPIVALYGALNAIFNVVLASRVSIARRRAQTSLGLGTDPALLHANRAHANNAEFVPLALVMLLIAELQGGGSTALHSMGGALLVGRILHVIGIPRKAPNPYRALGATMTWGVILAASGYCLLLRGG
jgi:uncharacterized membrane protein YecN with MAPEG domain